MSGIENIQLQTSDSLLLDGWIQKDSKKPYIILYFGGNGDETSYFIEKTWYQQANIVSFNYRGYGRSAGKPSEKGIFQDSLEIYDFLIQEKGVDPEKLILMGRSLGTGVATYLASQRKVKSVILVTPYDSVEKVAAEVYSFIPVHILLRHTFDSTLYAPIQRNNLLCIFGGKDYTILNHHTENLISHWNGSVEKLFLPEASHENIYDFSEVHDTIEKFIAFHH